MSPGAVCRTVRAAREAGLDYDGLRLFQSTVGLGALPQGIWDDCVKVIAPIILGCVMMHVHRVIQYLE